MSVAIFSKEGAVFRITPKGKVDLLVNVKNMPDIHTPNGVLNDGTSFLLMADFGSGKLHRIKLADKTSEVVAEGLEGADGLTWDHYGRLYISSWKLGKLWVIGRPGQKPVVLAEGFESAADTCLDPTGKFIIVPDMKAGTLTKVPAKVPGADVDMSALPLDTKPAFPKLKWTGWENETPDGKFNPLRPLILTHAGDGSNRNFVVIQQGTIHVFPNDQAAKETKIFLDISKKVFYDDKENEQGFLGLAFHPKYAKNGEFFAFYTLNNKVKGSKTPPVNLVSRFKVSKDDPDKADPASEEVLLKIERPFWNHDGGTICFGPDGYLYIAIGDGGLADDPMNNGQNLKTLLGKILRIDVDSKAPGKKYGIPKDNPYVGDANAVPETWAWGLRNPWRIAFDKKTGQLWCGDVGQNLYEEIDIITKGGNYGWRKREGLHPFGPEGCGPKPDLIGPIWEYHHDVGKSITGGGVYRGKKLPELEGAYLYADYVTGRIWALRYDEAKKRVVENRSIKDNARPIMSFGEDEQGEMYLMTYTVSGHGILQMVRTAGTKE